MSTPTLAKKSSLAKEVSPEEAAKILGVDPRTVRNFIKRGQLKAKKVNGCWFIDSESLEALKEFKASSPSSKNVPRILTGPNILAPYRLFLYAFSQFNWQFDLPEKERNRIEDLRISTQENLAAGFYSYDSEKKITMLRQELKWQQSSAYFTRIMRKTAM